jgi:Fe-S cluster biogenesis protein NfuA
VRFFCPSRPQAKLGGDKAAFVRVMVFANKAMCSRANLEAEAASWLRSSGPTLPPGNAEDSTLLGGTTPGGAEAVMTAVERASFEEKKLKMKRAMGVKDASDAVAGEAPDLAQRRADMIKALERDDWSSVIDGQTRDTVAADAERAGALGASAASNVNAPRAPYVVSPFSRAAVHRAVGDGDASASSLAAGEASSSSSSSPPKAACELSVASVDEALNEVRPYLIADGGNVEVASVIGGVVALRLQGACGTCSSSAATMKMGIERALKNAFGDALKEVIQVGAAPGAAPTDAAVISAHLEVLAPAIKAYGGVVVVKRVASGVAVIGFRGPAPLGQGIAAAVRDKFTDVHDVIFEEP